VDAVKRPSWSTPSGVRSEIGELRGEVQHLSRTMAFGFASIAASVIGSVAAVLISQAF
jgi:hypothetical protein